MVWRGPEILETFIHPLSGMMTFALSLPIIFWLGGDSEPSRGRRVAIAHPGERVISTRYVPAACVVIALALVPTIIHSYVGTVIKDGRTTAAISPTVAGFTSVPSDRDAGWGKRRFESDDWIERRYLSGNEEVLLTVLRSYDLKRLYHHPELDVAYGAGYLTEEIVELPGAEGVPVHFLRASEETDGTGDVRAALRRRLRLESVDLPVAGGGSAARRRAPADDADFRARRSRKKGRHSRYLSLGEGARADLEGIRRAVSESQGGRSGSGGGAGWLGSWFKPWFAATVAATVVASAFDAALLHRRRSYFTGGFLSVDYISTPAQAVAFVIGSLASDLAVLGILVVVALWGCRRLGLSAKASAVLAFEASLVPVVVVNFLDLPAQRLPGRRLRLCLDVPAGRTQPGRDPGGVLVAHRDGARRDCRRCVPAGDHGVAAPAALRPAAAMGAADAAHRRGVVRDLCCSAALSAPRCFEAAVTRSTTGCAANRPASFSARWSPRPPMSTETASGCWAVCGITAPLDASIHPFALDVPGNGIDEDAVGGDLPADLPPYREPQDSGPRWTGTPPIVLIALESFGPTRSAPASPAGPLRRP